MAKTGVMDGLAVDTLIGIDSVVPDSVAASETIPALVMEQPEPSGVFLPEESRSSYDTMSWVMAILFAVFCAVCLRYAGNSKYIAGLGRDLFEVRERGNAFDDTVRETSFLLILNLLWIVSAGVIMHSAITLWSLPPETAVGDGNALLPVLACMGVGLAYCLFIWVAYSIVGYVFTDRGKTSMWLRCFAANQGVTGFLWFPMALLCLCYPEMSRVWIWISAGIYAFMKMIVWVKGFRIFFTQIASWVLFLYYLCSLEIVPLILAYVSALQLCMIIRG